MQINGNIVVLPVPAEKQDLAYLPDRFETGERVQTPRGSFQVTAMSREQMEAAGYGVHHISDDGKYLIMGNGTRAFAVAAEQPEKDNPLRTAEMTLEDDYGMIDGVINNGRRGEELEKAQEYAERTTPEKPSIRERLEDAKRECLQKVYKDKSLGYSQDEKFNIPDDFDPCKDTLIDETSVEETGGLDNIFE